jgi:hypothetical protein
MSRQEANRNMETLTISELCSNSHPRRLASNGKVECWDRDIRKIPAAKAGNMAIPFQSEFKIRLGRTRIKSKNAKMRKAPKRRDP